MARFGAALGIAAALAVTATPVSAGPVRHALGTTLVPPPVAAPWSGGPHGPAGLTVASSTLTTLLDTADTAETGPAPWIARTMLELALRFRLGGIAEVRLPVELDFAQGALEPRDSGLPTPGPLGGGAGLGVAVSPELSDSFYLGFLFEMLLVAVPTDVVELCAGACEPGSFSRTTGGALGPLLRGTVLAGWKSERWRAWGGVSFRNQPGGIDELLSEDDAPVGSVSFGSGFATFVAGGEYRVVEGLALFLAVQQPVAFDREGPWHGPIVTGGIDGWIPDE
jgi:hypothetical protein